MRGRYAVRNDLNWHIHLRGAERKVCSLSLPRRRNGSNPLLVSDTNEVDHNKCRLVLATLLLN